MSTRKTTMGSNRITPTLCFVFASLLIGVRPLESVTRQTQTDWQAIEPEDKRFWSRFVLEVSQSIQSAQTPAPTGSYKSIPPRPTPAPTPSYQSRPPRPTPGPSPSYQSKPPRPGPAPVPLPTCNVVVSQSSRDCNDEKCLEHIRCS